PVKPRDQENKSVDIKLVVDEGPATKIEKLETDGLDPIGPEAQKIQHELKQTFKRGTVFDHGQYLEKKSALEGRMKQLGFAWANVHGEVDVNRDARTADVILKFDPGPKARFGHVYVRGYDVIDPKLILERAQISEGKPFDPQ